MSGRLRTPNGKLYQLLPGQPSGTPARYGVVRLDLCNCGGSMCEDDQSVYHCKGCDRWVPWCYGGADDLPDHCDDCWAEAHEKDEDMAKKKWRKIPVEGMAGLRVDVADDDSVRINGHRIHAAAAKRVIDLLYRSLPHGKEEIAGRGDVPMARVRKLANPSRDSVYAKMARELVRRREAERPPLNINEKIAREIDEEILKDAFVPASLASRLECPECGSEKVSHVDTATTWSSQCLACAHTWKAPDEWPTPAWAKEQVENELYQIDSSKLTVKAVHESGTPAPRFGPFFLSRYEYTMDRSSPNYTYLDMEFLQADSGPVGFGPWGRYGRQDTIKIRTTMPEDFTVMEDLIQRRFHLVADDE